MSSSGIKKLRTSQDRVIDVLREQEQEFIQNLKPGGTEKGGFGLVGLGGTSSGSPIPAGNYLKTAGGVMMGPIAYNPSTVSIVTNAINIGQSSEKSSTYVILDSSTTDLITITGAQFSGQDLILQGKTGSTITVKNSGNIVTSDGADYDIVGLALVRLIYDEASTKWRIYSTVGSGGGSGGWDGNATSILDMNGFDIQHIGKISFEVTSGTYPSIDVSADSSVMNFRVNGIGAMALSEASGDPTLEVIGNPNPAIKTRSTDGTPSDNQTVGGLYFDAFNSSLSLKTFGSLKMETADVTAGSEDGAFMMNLIKNGTGTNVLLFDNDRLLPQQTDIYDLGGGANRFRYTNTKYVNDVEQISFSNTISGQYFNSSTGGLQYYVPSGDNHKFLVNSVDIAYFDSTGLVISGVNDLNISSGDLTNGTGHNGNFTWSGTGNFSVYADDAYLYSDTTWIGNYGDGDICRMAATLNFTENTSSVNQTLPSSSDGYITIQIGGVSKKLFYYT